MKISHSARPRNRSSRNSRSPTAGNAIAGADGTAAASPLAAADVTLALAPSSGVPAIGSAMDVIWHRLDSWALRAGPDRNRSYRPATCTQDTPGIGPAVRSGALERNYVETAMKGRATGPSGDWFHQLSWL